MRSVYADAQIGYVWYHKVFIIQTKLDRLTIFMYSKTKEEFKYQNMETD